MFASRQTSSFADVSTSCRRTKPLFARVFFNRDTIFCVSSFPPLFATLVLTLFLALSSAESRAANFSFLEFCGATDPPQSSETLFDESFPGSSLLPSSYVSPEASSFSLDAFAENYSVDETPIYRGTDLSILSIYPYRGRVFGHFLASWGAQDSQGVKTDVGGFDVGSFGGAIGQDWTLTQHFLWGYGIQATQTTIDAKNTNSYDSSIDSLAGFLRMSVFDALWHIDLLYGGARNWVRHAHLTTDAYTKFADTQCFFESEFGARFDKGYTRIEPRLNFRALTLVEPSSAERFIVSKARSSSFSSASYRMKLGSRFSWEYATTLGVSKPYITVDWSHEFGNRAIYTIDDQASIPVGFRFGRHKMARDKLLFGAGLDYALEETFDVYFRYDAEVAKEYSAHLFFAGFNKKF